MTIPAETKPIQKNQQTCTQTKTETFILLKFQENFSRDKNNQMNAENLTKNKNRNFHYQNSDACSHNCLNPYTYPLPYLRLT